MFKLFRVVAILFCCVRVGEGVFLVYCYCWGFFGCSFVGGWGGEVYCLD